VHQPSVATCFSLFGAGAPRGRTIEQVFVDSGLAGKRDGLTQTLYYGEQRQLELALALPAPMRAKPASPVLAPPLDLAHGRPS
jgi:hypothetical protein